MNKMDEMILAVAREDLLGEGDSRSFQGFQTNEVDVLSHIPYVEKRRGDLEEDATYKQLISYVIIRAKAENKILTYQRIGGGDARLHLNSSIGVGGHANKVTDAQTMKEIMLENALRELHEEVTISNEAHVELTHIGFLNDDSDEVGRVHVGVIYEASVESIENVQVAETETLEMHWSTVDELKNDATLENWSKILVPHL